MKRGIIFLLLFFGCTQVNSPEEKVSKSALIIGHYRSFDHSIIPDSTSRLAIGTIISIGDPVPCGSVCDSIKTQLMHAFVRDKMGNCVAVYFSKTDNSQTAVVKFPFSQSVIRYNGAESSRLYIDSIINTSRCYIRFMNTVLHIDAGDTMKVVDTLIIRADSNHGWWRTIITHKIVNYGVSVLPDKRFNEFF